MAHRKTIHRRLFFLHRYLGIASAAFVVLLATTGLLLNHTEDLKLDQRHVQWAPLLNWYGIEAPRIDESYRVDDRWYTRLAGRLYINGQVTIDASGPLLGAVDTAEFDVVAFESELLLFTKNGELVERLGSVAGVPNPIHKIGIDAGYALPVIQTAEGVFVADQELFEWQDQVADSKLHWAKPAAPPAELVNAISQAYLGHGLNMERIFLDLHSGRIAGAIGVLVMDIVAVIFLVLAAVGVWLWARR